MPATLLQQLPGFFSYYNLRLLAEALGTTFLLSAVGCLIGFLVGFIFACLRVTVSPWLKPVRIALYLYAGLFRRVPFLVTLMLVFFFTQALDAGLSTFSVALLSVCLIAVAYLSEIIRSGLVSIHPNQWEAAHTMNFGFWQTLRHVIVPQAWRVMLPPTFSFFVLFIKDTALASQIGVMELTSAGKVLNNKGFSASLTYATVLVLYFALSYPLARWGQRMEKKLAATRNR